MSVRSIFRNITNYFTHTPPLEEDAGDEEALLEMTAPTQPQAAAEEADVSIAINEEMPPKIKKKKKAKSGELSDSDDEGESKKAPSMPKAFTVTAVAMLTLGFATYYKMNPIVTVGIGSIAGTAAKTLLRRVNQLPRYAGLFVATSAGFGIDYLTPYNDFNFGPIMAGIAFPTISRLVKLWILGKIEKDKPAKRIKV